MSKRFLQANLQKSGDKISFVASDETLDRSGEVIPITSWDLTNFMRNPVLLVDHDYRVEKIVGVAENIRIEGKKLMFDPIFHEITDLAKNVKEMVIQEVLNTVSVGFLPHGPVKDGDQGRNELLEVSFVAVPANPSAERLKTLSAAVTSEKNMQIESWVKAQNQTLDAIRVEVLKSKYSEDEAKKWVADHNYKFKSMEESDKSFVFHLVDPAVKCEGEPQTINVDEGVKLFACRLTERAGAEEGKQAEDIFIKGQTQAQLEEEIKDLLNENAELKEGRVLSGKNRKLVENAVSNLKQLYETIGQAIEPLEKLLDATDAGKGVEGRESKMGEEKNNSPVPKKGSSSLRRTLQRINKDSNLLLRELKD